MSYEMQEKNKILNQVAEYIMKKDTKDTNSNINASICSIFVLLLQSLPKITSKFAQK